MTNFSNLRCRSAWLLALLPACALDAQRAQLALGADAGAEPEVAVTEEALLGGTNFENADTGQFAHWSCSPSERKGAMHSGIVGRTLASSTAVKDCIAWTMQNAWLGTGPYRPCIMGASDRDPLPGQPIAARIAGVQSTILSPAPVAITCMDGEGIASGIATVGSFDGSEHVGVEIDNVFSAIANLSRSYEDKVHTLATAASHIWHEAMHSQGYWHDTASRECGNQTLFQSVPEIVDSCMEKVARASIASCPRDMCTDVGRMPVISEFSPWPIIDNLTMDADACECIRDPSGASDISTYHPASPVLGLNEENDLFGYAIASGDFDGDHFDDLAVGVPRENEKGLVLLYRGSVTGLYPWKKLPAFNKVLVNGDQFGFALTVGDFNDDGLDDLAVGAPQKAVGSGLVFVYLGSAQLGLTGGGVYAQDQAVSATGDRFGYALAAGDFDDDGLDDLAVGAPYRSVGGASSGFAYLMRGHRTSGSGVLTMWAGLSQSPVDANSSGDLFGASLAAGYINGAVVDRLVVGAPGDGGKGRVFLFSSQVSATDTTWTAARSMRPSGLDTGAGFGRSVAIGTTRTASPQTAIIAGAPDHGESADRAGAVFVMETTGTVRQLISHSVADSRMGSTLAIARVNDDDLDDLLIGHDTANAGGAVHVHPGGPVLWATSGLTQSGGADEAGDRFGFAIAAGDFDGDGFTDVAAGAPGERSGTGPEAGYVFTFRGLGNGHFRRMESVGQEL